jgi:lysozyme
MQNGRLTQRELAPIYHPKLRVFLASASAAASWNTMRLFLLQRYGERGEIYPEGPLGAYRDYAEQVECKKQYGSNAAVPGTSNHGLGHAVDLADHFMAGLVDKHGGLFGWHHWDAKWEWWHREYDGGFDRPDPGPDQQFPALRKGSGGVGQAPYVARVQRRLTKLGFPAADDGDFGPNTAAAVRAFQRSRRLTANGTLDLKSWQALGQATPPTPAPRPRPKPKPRPNPEPAPALLRGFDVSDVQGDVDFTKAHGSGNAFAVVRVADGDVRDTRYGPGRVAALRQSGLAWFPYYFGRVASAQNNQRDGAAEAALAIRLARKAGWGRKTDLPLAYDFETANGQSAPKCARHLLQFVDAYRKERGHFPIVYTEPSFWTCLLPHLSTAQSDRVRRCPLWLAHWDVPRPQPIEPWGDAWLLWQYSDHGRIAGVSTKCDTDYFRGTADEFRSLLVG